MSEIEARPHLEAGEEHLRLQAWSEAERAFRQAIALHESSAVAWSKLGVALARQRRYEEAMNALRRAIDIDPRYAPAHSNLGNVHQEQGRFDEALRAYKQAIEVDPDYWIAHQNLGALYREMGRVGEAVAEFRKATRLSMRSPGGVQRRGCLLPSGAAVIALAVILVGMLLAAWQLP